MRFKRENWQPTIGDKFDFYVFNKRQSLLISLKKR